MAATCKPARDWYTRFHGAPPSQPGDVIYRPGRGCMARLGPVPAQPYHAARPHKPRGVDWEHEFGPGAAPDLYRDARGKLQLEGGAYRVSSQQGITDMAKKKHRKKHRNPSHGRRGKHRNPYRSPSGGGDLSTWGMRLATVGATAGAYAVVSKVVANRYMAADAGATAEQLSANERNRNLARAAVALYLGWALKRKYGNVAAGLATAGAIILFEELSRGIEAERRLMEMMPDDPARPGVFGTPTSSTNPAHGLPDGSGVSRLDARGRQGVRATTGG
jgi:hypothetical protein